jgi:hypothetical protein
MTTTSRLMELAGIGQSEMLIEAVEIPDNVSLDQIASMMDAAKRGLGIVNKMKNPVDKKKHASAVLSNMNKIRSALQRVISSME